MFSKCLPYVMKGMEEGIKTYTTMERLIQFLISIKSLKSDQPKH